MKNSGATTDYICANCNKRPGTQRWFGDTSAMGWIHSMPQMWCERCVIEAQLDYARKMASNVPELEKKLEQLT